MKGFPDVPPVWLGTALGGVWVLDRFVPQMSFTFTGQFAFGWLCIGIAFFLILWSAIWFRKKRTTIEPNDTATSLIVEGPFRISRNPIYVSLALITLGMIIGRGTVLGLPILLGLIWVLHTRFVLPEEQGLRDVFGAEAEAYFKMTRRWL